MEKKQYLSKLYLYFLLSSSLLKTHIFVIFIAILSPLTWASTVQWSSFGTLGLTLSDSNKYGYRSDISSDNGVFSGDVDLKSLTLIGGQVELAASRKLDFIGQVVLRDLNDAKFSDYVTMAFMRYKPSASWSFRAGRVTSDLFRITEYRDVNVAYTWANVPNEVYGILPFKALDGVDVSYKTKFVDGTINVKVYAGESQSVVFANGINENFGIKDMLGLTITYDELDWNIQVRYTNAKLGNNGKASALLAENIALVPSILWPDKDAFISTLSVENTQADYYSLSGQRDWHHWLFSFELGQISSENDVTATIHSGYLSAAYRQGSHTYYGLLGATSADNYTFDEPADSSFFPELVVNIERFRNFYSSNQTTISLGWRWDLNATLTSKLQINHTQIDQNGATLWVNPNLDNTSSTVTSLMYTLSFAL